MPSIFKYQKQHFLAVINSINNINFSSLEKFQVNFARLTANTAIKKNILIPWKLKKQIEFLDVQEEYIKDEMRNLRKVK